jgi:signal transduction histidine kinase
MKFWIKIFLCSFVVLLIAFDTAGILWISDSFNSSLKSERASALAYHENLRQSAFASLYYWQKELADSPDLYQSYLSEIFSGLAQSGNGESIVVKSNSGAILFSSAENIERQIGNELKPDANGNITSAVLKQQDIRFIGAASNLKVGDQTYMIYTIRDISALYQSQRGRAEQSILFGSVICLIAAGIMGFLSFLLTRPLSWLSDTAVKIARGDYSRRSEILSKDEFGELSKQINVMAVAVENREEQLRAEAEQRQRFVESFTHELKTPLTSIIAYSDLIRAVELDQEEIDEDLSYISSEGRRLEAMSRKLLSLYSINQSGLIFKEIPLSSLFSDIEKVIRPLLEKKHIRLESSQHGLSITADDDMMKSLLYNLLDNAVKASPEGGLIKLYSEDGDNDVKIVVKDYGAGIPEKDLPHVLEPFYMADKSRSRKDNGAGLGLSLCNSIAQAHGAVLSIQSKPGEGTEAVVSFPKEGRL